MAKKYPDLICNYPESIDSRIVLSDITEDMIPVITQYKNYIANQNFIAANAILESNPQLKNCGLSAEYFNKLSDRTIALEKELNESKTTITTLSKSVNENAGAINYFNPILGSLLGVGSPQRETNIKIADCVFKSIQIRVNATTSINYTFVKELDASYTPVILSAPESFTINGINSAVIPIQNTSGKQIDGVVLICGKAKLGVNYKE